MTDSLTMFKILNDDLADVLDKESENYVVAEDEPYDDTAVFQEDISPELARALLPPNVFNADCRYQLVTLPDKTLVLCIDDRIPKGMESVGRQRITEYLLTSPDDVMSLSELKEGMLFYPKRNLPHYRTPDDIPKRSNLWIWVTSITCLLLLALGVCIFTYLLTL